MQLLLVIALSYLLGSFPTAILYGKVTRGIDIRQHGSGNAGATNIFRVLGWKAGLLVLLIDAGKGLVATLFIYKIAIGTVAIDTELIKIIAGLSAVFGHIWTIFAGFKGGKGVGTGAGMIIGLVPLAVLAAVMVFIITVAISRYVSLGSILGSLVIPAYLLIQKFVLNHFISNSLLIFSLFVPLLIIYTHRSNIIRLVRGEENRISLK